MTTPDELTVEQAWDNIVTGLATFQGTRRQWQIMEASIAMVAAALIAEDPRTNSAH